MKKISAFLLLIVSFLFVGMFMPNTYAAPSGTFQVKVSLLTNESVEWTESLTYSSGQLSYGHEFSIDASTIELEDKEFAFWLVNGLITNRPASTTFIVTTDLEVIAVFRPDDELVVLYVDSNNELVDVDYVEMNGSATTLLDGTTLTKPGFLFAGWNNSQTDITVDTVIKALYDLDPLTQQVTINILDNTGTGAGTFDYNELVTVTADIEGFTHWSENGEVVSYDPTYTFSAIKNRTLKAETGGTDTPVVFLQDVTGIRAQHESYLGQVYLPEGYTLMETGLLVSDTVPVPTYGIEGVEAVVSSSINTITNEFLRSIPDSSEYRFVRGYAVVDNGNEFEIIYSLSFKHSIMIWFDLWLQWENPEAANDPFVTGDFLNPTWSAESKLVATMDINQNRHYYVGYLLVWFGSTSQYIEYKWGHNEFDLAGGYNRTANIPFNQLDYGVGYFDWY